MQPTVHTLAANPRMSRVHAADVVRLHWGLEGDLHDLGSLQDQNFRLTTADRASYVVKVARPSESRAELALQNAAMRHVAEHDESFASPVPVATLAGADIVSHEGHDVRLLTWVDGSPLVTRRHVRRSEMVELGNLAGRTAVALAGFTHPAMDRTIRWDARYARQVAAEIGEQLKNPDHRAMVTRAMQCFDAVEARADRLPRQVVHGDVTDVNAVWCNGSHDVPSVNGVLDFGDVMHTWRIADLAATATSIAGHASVIDVLDGALATLHGYASACPLTEDEIEAFWPLVIVRAAINLIVSEIQFELNPASDYTRDSSLAGIRTIERVLAVPAELATVAARATVGLPPRPANTALGQWLRRVQPADVVPGASAAPVVDLSVDSDTLAFGEWLDAATLAAVIPGPISIGRWGEARLADGSAPQPNPVPQLHLGADVFAPAGTVVFAPVAGEVVRYDDREIVLDLPGTEIFLRIAGLVTADGLDVHTSVSAGTALGTVAPAYGVLPPHVHVQLQITPDLPCVGTARHRTAWLAACPDPSALLGVSAAAPQPPAPERARRDRVAHVASAQHLYYDAPIEITRGWRQFLYDSDGRPYLDMINNIASVGHSHPRIAAAAARQFRRLNTNSRFLYDSMTRYARRISNLLPAELNRVFLVNSGSEAADLALQLARVFTARRDVIAIAGAYHGWTGAVIDISTSPVDRPQWREELPPYVHVIGQPDPYRGAFGDDAAAYCDTVRAACASAEAGGGVAAFISEPLLGNQGAVEPVPGFLRGAYDLVRAAGGMCIADEVQVGMGRTGDHFWAFEHEGVVPDIVFTAKATGNGHPLGVVVCRDEIADRFDGRTAYFSSTGGGPVSCEIGIAVLDVIRDEQLQPNAHEVGRYLASQLRVLADRHERIGAIHGRGLYLGVDLVSDRRTKQPDTVLAHALSERLLELGVIMQPTGDALNVLKVKPPLCIDHASADYFVSMLDRALGEVGDN